MELRYCNGANTGNDWLEFERELAVPMQAIEFVAKD